jgi:hypothetical protein
MLGLEYELKNIYIYIYRVKIYLSSGGIGLFSYCLCFTSLLLGVVMILKQKLETIFATYVGSLILDL